ncbi:hypothetical protein phiAS5_ORF0026 [Aeromonas phage phiAS5]|uniref:Uncharacterized protein n=1 Tax=Aeromonas phage phiAS5 TaxID=879630 RepID=E1A2C3_9CAUD|nr:hypothetical protein phiAS5_ORF0026 [Aeromonas phage phiAS5]ADM79869.1 hypothetical protein phiAS5_ORF0026 [Aeromonas phage phiAS5]BES53025.1 hypothetical protein [Aeromonas phage phiWae14]
MTNATKIKAHFMNENGTSKAQIARELNVSASTVSRWIKEVEAARVAAKTITVIDEDNEAADTVEIPVMKTDVVNGNNRVYPTESVEIPVKVVQRRKVWTYTPVKKQEKRTNFVKPVQPQTAMSMAFAAALAG